MGYQIEYYRLQCPCPFCRGLGRTVPIVYWSHYEDGGSIYVGSDGNLMCGKCGARAHLRSWKFNCPNHSGVPNSVSFNVGVYISSDSFVEALGLSMPFLRNISPKWMSNLLLNVY